MKKVYEVIEIDLDKDLYDKLIKLAKEEIVKDDPALIDYICAKILVSIVDNEEQFIKMVKKVQANDKKHHESKRSTNRRAGKGKRKTKK